MASSTMASRLITAASLLLEEGSRSTAIRRRAVSTAYYAVFHAIAKVCADYVTHSTDRTMPEYERAYRALEHGQLKKAFSQSPLNDDGQLSGIGAIAVQLQAERHRADYLPPVLGVFSRSEAQELVERAADAVADLEALESGSNKRRLLATSLLFRERRP